MSPLAAWASLGRVVGAVALTAGNFGRRAFLPTLSSDRRSLPRSMSTGRARGGGGAFCATADRAVRRMLETRVSCRVIVVFVAMSIFLCRQCETRHYVSIHRGCTRAPLCARPFSNASRSLCPETCGYAVLGMDFRDKNGRFEGKVQQDWSPCEPL